MIRGNYLFRFGTIITTPSLLLPFIDIFSALCGNGMLESMLAPHLRETGATTIGIGVSFVVFGCCFIIGSTFFGFVSHRIGYLHHHITPNFQAIDKVGYPVCFSLAGNVMFMITFIFIGPLSFIPILPSMHLIQVKHINCQAEN